MIPANDVRKTQDDAEARAGEPDNPCFRCGEHVDVDRVAAWVRLATSDVLIGRHESPEDVSGRCQGWFPLGARCAMLVPADHLYAMAATTEQGG